MEALKRQVGGTHYKQYKIEPIVYVCKNKIIHTLANIIKYASRANTRDNLEANQLRLKLEDLDKIIHYAEIEKEVAIEEYKEHIGEEVDISLEDIRQPKKSIAPTSKYKPPAHAMVSHADSWTPHG